MCILICHIYIYLLRTRTRERFLTSFAEFYELEVEVLLQCREQRCEKNMHFSLFSIGRNSREIGDKLPMYTYCSNPKIRFFNFQIFEAEFDEVEAKMFNM